MGEQPNVTGKKKKKKEIKGKNDLPQQIILNFQPMILNQNENSQQTDKNTKLKQEVAGT